MLCEICYRPAVGHCTKCGVHFCRAHGNETCLQCSGAFTTDGLYNAVEIVETNIYTNQHESRQRGGRGGYLQCEMHGMPTVYIDDEAPECYSCGGYGKYHCRHCQVLSCEEHLTSSEICKDCESSSLWGVYVFLGALALLFASLWVVSLFE
ncbi:MAG: hypothetical protein ACFCD0_28760 [Gemmataceae bacterium]